MSKKFALTSGMVAIATVLFLVVNLAGIVIFKATRLDLTDGKLYTLSPGSKDIIKQVQEPVTLKFYFSKKIAKANPYLLSFAARVQDLLVQYERAGRGRIVLQVIDPEPFSAQEDEAVNYGLRGVPVDNSGTELYFGLVAQGKDGFERVIPFMQPAREANLEYDISQLLFNVVHPEPRLIGVMSALPLEGRGTKPWAIWQQLSQLFELRSLPINSREIPQEITTLMIVDPSSFTKAGLKAVDDFVLRGGHVLAFVDPHIEVTDAQTSYLNGMLREGDSDYMQLLRAWGIDMVTDKVVADRNLAKIVRASYDGRDVTLRFPLWMDFAGENFDKKDVLSSSLERVTLATPGALTKIEGTQSIFTPLMTTSDQAMLVDKNKVEDYEQNVPSLLQDYQPSGQFVVAARISGQVSSAFRAADAPDAMVKNANIIVIADADMLHDHFWVSVQNVMGEDFAMPVASNGNLVLSALDNLTGSDALISIRNRGSFVRPFERIQQLELSSQDKFREKEQLLQQQLETTKRKLEALETQKADGNVLQLTDKQKQEQETFRNELIQTRQELRDVRRQLNANIERLEFGVKFVAIGLVPLLIMLIGLVVWFRQGRMRSLGRV